MSQQIAQCEPLTIPGGATTLVAAMSWDLPGSIRPEPWALAYDQDGIINGQHAHMNYRRTRGGIIALERSQPTAQIDLEKLIEEYPNVGGISIIASLYAGPQSRVKFSKLVKASVEIGGRRYRDVIPIARHDVDLESTDLDTFFLPLASIVRKNDTWSLARGWCPLRYGL